MQIEAITSLAQFYDPPLQCFTFQDFQLAPTLDECNQILISFKKTRDLYWGIRRVVKVGELATLLNLPDLIQYKIDGEVYGLHMAYLERKAQELAKKKIWEKLSDMLALLMFGLILFPNLEGFIDAAAISVFWATRIFDEDYMHAILGDVYSILKVKYIKKRRLMLCCIPSLY